MKRKKSNGALSAPVTPSPTTKECSKAQQQQQQQDDDGMVQTTPTRQQQKQERVLAAAVIEGEAVPTPNEIDLVAREVLAFIHSKECHVDIYATPSCSVADAEETPKNHSNCVQLISMLTETVLRGCCHSALVSFFTSRNWHWELSSHIKASCVSQKACMYMCCNLS